MDDSFAVEALARCPLFAACRRADRCARWPIACAAAAIVVARSSTTRETRATRCTSWRVGAIKIVLPSTEGEEAIIATLRPGDFHGELALLDGAPRSATATAVEPSEDLVLPRTVFIELLDMLPGLRDALLAGLAQGAAAPDRPRRGAPLPRPCRPAGDAPDAPRAGRRRRMPQGSVTSRLALHPVRPGGDDRRHAPEREPAAERVRGRGPDQDRGRRARHLRPAAPGAAGRALRRRPWRRTCRQVRHLRCRLRWLMIAAAVFTLKSHRCESSEQPMKGGPTWVRTSWAATRCSCVAAKAPAR